MIIVPKELPMKEFLRFFLIFSPSFLFVIYSSLSPYNDAPEYIYTLYFSSQLNYFTNSRLLCSLLIMLL